MVLLSHGWWSSLSLAGQARNPYDLKNPFTGQHRQMALLPGPSPVDPKRSFLNFPFKFFGYL
jgi:hypothetical protein